jgi:hypothetical protein
MIADGPPAVYEYRIARGPDGRPERTATGEIAIAFGPADHTDATHWPRLGTRWVPLRLVPWLADIPDLY